MAKKGKKKVAEENSAETSAPNVVAASSSSGLRKRKSESSEPLLAEVHADKRQKRQVSPPARKCNAQPLPRSSFLSFIFRIDVIGLLLFGSALRVVLFHSAGHWLAHRPEFATPLVAIDRLREGILLEQELGDAYEGDRVHLQPLLIRAASLAKSAVAHDKVWLGVLVVLDALSALFFAAAARYHAAENAGDFCSVDQLGTSALKWYLLNPLSIATCASLSVAVVYIHIAAAFTYSFFARRPVPAVLLLALWSQLCMYPCILLAPLVSQLRSHASMVLLALCYVVATLALVGVNFVLAGQKWTFADHTYAFTVRVDDLTPNVGIFWYFFTEIFDHFRDFFLFLFQLNLAVYIIPLVVTLWNAPHLCLIVSYVLLTVFVPYPSLADATVFFALLPFIEDKYKEHMRFTLVSGCALVACIALMPVTWHIWIVSGSGNANFYFGVTLVYNVALIQLGIDLVYGFIRKDIEERCPEDVPDKKTILVFD